jgi:hypothetical protein
MVSYADLRAIIHVTDAGAGTSKDVTVGPPHIQGWNNLAKGWSVGGNSSGTDVEIDEALSGIDLGIFPASNHIILWGILPAEAKIPDIAVRGYDGKWVSPIYMDGNKLSCRFDQFPLRVGHHEIRVELIFPTSGTGTYNRSYSKVNPTKSRTIPKRVAILAVIAALMYVLVKQLIGK